MTPPEQTPSLLTVPVAQSVETNPWLGLASYCEADSAIFFGREQETAELLRLIDREALTVLFGRSGLGKTSLIHAGAIPTLRQTKKYFPVPLRLDFSGESGSPVRQLIAILNEAARLHDVEVADAPQDRPDLTLWEYLHQTEFWSPRNDLLTPVLFIDQFEEVFTLGRGVAAVGDFLEQLADLAENRIPKSLKAAVEASGALPEINGETRNYKIVLSLREDYVSRLDQLRTSMPSILRNRFSLQALAADRALAVVVRAGGRWISPEVAREVIAVVVGNKDGEPLSASEAEAVEIEPAYLSVMCHELFLRMISLGRDAITCDLVEQEHGGILEALYQRSFEGMDRKPRIFVEDRLLTASGFRAAVPVAEAMAEGLSAQDLYTLVNRRLLRFEDRLGAQHIEISHDLLTSIVHKSREQRHAEQEREETARRARGLRRALLRMRIRAAFAIAVAVIVVGGAIFYWAAYVHMWTTYYNGFGKKYGAPYPYGRLTAEAVRHRGVSLEIRRKGFLGPILEMRTVDSLKQLTVDPNLKTYLQAAEDETSNTVCRLEYVYDNSHRLSYETAWDKQGRMIWGLVYAPPGAAGNSLKTRRATFVGPDNLPLPQRSSRAEVIEFHYDSRGFEVKMFFLDREGNLAPGPDNAFGKQREYDDQGRMTKDTSLDQAGNPMNDQTGNASAISQYDSLGDPTEFSAYDKDGKSTIIILSGYAFVRQAYDRWGNPTEQSFYGMGGWNDPILASETEVHAWRIRYDARGNRIEIAAFDVKNQPADAKNGIHRTTRTYDGNNRLIAEAYFKKTGEAVKNDDGIHEYRDQYDANGYVSEMSFFDGQGKPYTSADGFQKVTKKNDSRGNVLEYRYFEANGKPVTSAKGYAVLSGSYDTRGRLTSASYYDLQGRPVLEKENGIARQTWAYDRFGNTKETAYFGVKGEKINCKSGYQKEVAQFNQFGLQIQVQYFDVNGSPVLNNVGYFEKDSEYDNSGLLIKETYKNTSGTISGGKDGIAVIRYAYNTKRQQIEQTYFGPKGEAVNNSSGVHSYQNSYNNAGQPTGTQRRSATGAIVANNESNFAGFHEIKDAAGRVIEQDNYDQSGHPAMGPHGYAIGKIEYDKAGHIIAARSYDTQNHLVNSFQKIAIMLGSYDSRGNVTEEKYYDKDNKPAINIDTGYAHGKYQYNSAGKQTDQSYFGADGKAIESLGGYARLQAKYDAEENCIESDFYNRHGTLVLRQMKGGNQYVSEKSTVVLRKIGKSIYAMVTQLPGDNTLAKQIHLHVGDVLLSYDGKEYAGKEAADILKWIENFAEGSDRMRKLVILRDGEMIEMNVPKGKFGARLVDPKLD